MKPHLIGLYSSAAGAGKSTVAEMLGRYGYTTLSFATPIKQMLAALLTELGYTPNEIASLIFEDKEQAIDKIHPRTSARHMLRTLGTEWGRQCVHPHIWLTVWKERKRQLDLVARTATNQDAYIVVDDVRFTNEADFIRSFGGHMWQITRPGTHTVIPHASEGGLDTYAHFTQTLENDSTLADLETNISHALHVAPVLT